VTQEPQRGKTSWSFTASLVAIAISTLTFLLSQLDVGGGLATAVVYVFFAAAVATLVLVQLKERAQELRDAKEDLDLEETVKETIPTNLWFRRRTDVLTLGDGGDAELEWDFELALPGDDGESRLNFPIFAESDGSDTEYPIAVKSIKVDGVARETRDALEPIEFRKSLVPGRPSSQYAVLTVPVGLGPMHGDSCRVQITLAFNGVFRNAFDDDSWSVDIPHVTESLEVTIRAPQKRVGLPVNTDNPVEAISALMDVPDHEESTEQSKQSDYVEDSLHWKTTSPKLGYRYKVHFRVESRDVAANT
jgi:hypothetical protein